MLLILHLLACAAVQGNGTPAEEPRVVDGAVAFNNSTFVEVRWTAGESASATLSCDENILPYLSTEVDDGVLRLRTSPPNAILNAQVDCQLELTTPCLRELSLSGSGAFIAESEVCGLNRVHMSGSGEARLGSVVASDFEWHGSGSGALVVEQLSADALDLRGSGSGGASLGVVDVGDALVDLSGSGGVDMEGVGDSLTLEISGGGGLDARAMEVLDLDARLSSSGDAHVAVSGVVDARLSGSGSLHLYGEPEAVNADVSGSGDVVQH